MNCEIDNQNGVGGDGLKSYREAGNKRPPKLLVNKVRVVQS